ncbi:hypothetical protein IJT93_11500 [bacterium]|nr:hypothetical protein [bacterium]
MNKRLLRAAMFLAAVCCCLASDGFDTAQAQNYPKASRRKPSAAAKPAVPAAATSVNTSDSSDADLSDEELQKAKERQAEYEKLQKQDAEFNSWKQQNEINKKNQARKEYNKRVSDDIIMEKYAVNSWQGLADSGYAKMMTSGTTENLLQEHKSQYNDIKRLFDNYRKGFEPHWLYPDIQASDADLKTYRELLNKEINIRVSIVRAYERELKKRNNYNFNPVDNLFSK